MAFYDHHFQRRGGGPLGRWKDSREDRKLLDLVLRLHPRPEIVEVGPGIGHFAVHCKAVGIPYVAIEPNAQQAEFIERLGYRVHRCLVPPLPLADDTCDIFYASQVIEHMPDRHAAVRLVEEALRVVRPGGWIVLTAPDIASWREFFWEDYTHNYPTSPRRLLTMFQDLGIADCQVVPYCASLFGPLRLLMPAIGLLLPYRWLNRITRSSVKRGMLFNLKAATLERFVIVGRVPTLQRDAVSARLRRGDQSALCGERELAGTT